MEMCLPSRPGLSQTGWVWSSLGTDSYMTLGQAPGGQGEGATSSIPGSIPVAEGPAYLLVPRASPVALQALTPAWVLCRDLPEPAGCEQTQNQQWLQTISCIRAASFLCLSAIPMGSGPGEPAGGRGTRGAEHPSLGHPRSADTGRHPGTPGSPPRSAGHPEALNPTACEKPCSLLCGYLLPSISWQRRANRA